MRDNAVALIDEYIAHRLERERQILEAIAARHHHRGDARPNLSVLDERLHGAAESRSRRTGQVAG